MPWEHLIGNGSTSMPPSTDATEVAVSEGTDDSDAPDLKELTASLDLVNSSGPAEKCHNRNNNNNTANNVVLPSRGLDAMTTISAEHDDNASVVDQMLPPNILGDGDAAAATSATCDHDKYWPCISNWSLTKNRNNGQTAPLFRYRQARFSSRRVRRRVVFKHGDCNVVQGNVAKRRRRYLQDIFTTLVDAQWRWTLLVFALNFILSWLCFAAVWCLIVRTHGDLEEQNHLSNKTWVPCIRDVRSFSSCFLFSVETQHTIGYGSKHVTDECPEAIFVLCLQSITGVMIQAFMVGVVFAKLSRPKKRTQTLLFSRKAVICQREGELCFMFRVGDMRKSHIIEAHVRAQLIKKKTTIEGEVLPFFQQELKVGGDGVEDRIFFIWPTTIVHKITASSPLYKISATDMLHEKFEIVVILEGVIESTGMTTQARSSYLPNEILWGHRFATLVSFKRETGEHEVDYSLFNSTYEVDTPLCSAYSLEQFLAGHHAVLNKYESVDATTSDDADSQIETSVGSLQHLPEFTRNDDRKQSCDIVHLAQHLPGPESDV